jgi:hypothetical protein
MPLRTADTVEVKAPGHSAGGLCTIDTHTTAWFLPVLLLFPVEAGDLQLFPALQ